MTIYHRYREASLVHVYILYTKSLSENTKTMSVVSFREQKIGASKRVRPLVTEKPDILTGRHFPAPHDNPNHHSECVVSSDRSANKISL